MRIPYVYHMQCCWCVAVAVMLTHQDATSDCRITHMNRCSLAATVTALAYALSRHTRMERVRLLWAACHGRAEAPRICTRPLVREEEL